jgi:hypothetical protein
MLLTVPPPLFPAPIEIRVGFVIAFGRTGLQNRHSYHVNFCHYLGELIAHKLVTFKTGAEGLSAKIIENLSSCSNLGNLFSWWFLLV